MINTLCANVGDDYNPAMKNDRDKRPTAKDSHYARLRRAHRDAQAAKQPSPPEDVVLLYGLHTVRAAIENPNRTIHSMKVTRNALNRLEIENPDALPFELDMVTPQVIDKMLPPDAIHQGVVVEAATLPVRRISSLADSPLVLMLDQVTDPHNVGAIMRSAVAFAAGAIVTTLRHSPQESGVLAKSASGALELIPYVQITNLAEAIEALHELGFLSVGLDSEGTSPTGGHACRRTDLPGPRRRRQRTSPENPGDRKVAGATRYARRHQVAQCLKCSGNFSLCSSSLPTGMTILLSCP